MSGIEPRHKIELCIFVKKQTQTEMYGPLEEIRRLSPTCIPVPLGKDLDFFLAMGVEFPDLERARKLSNAAGKLMNCERMIDVKLPTGWGLYRPLTEHGTTYENMCGIDVVLMCDETGTVVAEIDWNYKVSVENLTKIQLSDGYITKRLWACKYVGPVVNGWITLSH